MKTSTEELTYRHDPHARAARGVDARALVGELQGKIDGEVRFDDGSRALYARDASNYRQVPIGVVVPRSKEDVVKTMAVCRHFGAPILGRGGGTSLAGQCCNAAVVLDFSKYMHHVLEINPEEHWARVEPGCILDDLRKQAKRHGFTFGPDPSTHSHCTLGGMIGNNSCGIHSVQAGRTADNTHELDILTYNGLRMLVGQVNEDGLQRLAREDGPQGEIYRRLMALRDKHADLIRARYPNIPRRVSGYNLDQLLPEYGVHVARSLVGTEGTCVMVLEAKVNLIKYYSERTLLVLGYPDVYSAGDHITQIMEYGPIGLEGLDDQLVVDMKKNGIHASDAKLLPDGGGWLLVEFGGDTKEEAREKAESLRRALEHHPDAPNFELYAEREPQEAIWKVREAGLGATAFIPDAHDAWPGWEDSAVPPERVGPYLRDLRNLFHKHGYNASLYGHFGQGCIHCRIDFGLKSEEGLANYRSFMEEATDLVVSYGGSLSGEHGDGQSRAEFLPKMFGPELVDAFRDFKEIWDPRWKMNPGKVVDPYRIEENLTLGENYNPPNPKTHFTYPTEGGTFARAALRCVGIGNCRREEGGTMCPSYMVTREEKHSTRGRDHLLFEMLQGDVIRDGWRSEEVKEALDLCLACKGCKGECPVNVDMATYKAEFLSHYHQHHLRPREAYAMGWIHRWARLAALMPRAVNFFSQTPGFSGLLKFAGGIAQQRQVPAFATETFRDWFSRRAPRNLGAEQVLLWPDTFNNYFHPEVGKAAVEVLEHAGYRVTIPDRVLCCGRPLYDYGMLDEAEHLLRQVLDGIRPQIRAGMPLIGLEPSCLAAFRDELHNLFPHDEDAQRLKQQAFMFGEFLNKKADGYQPPQLRRKALLHGHCHHKAVLKFENEWELLRKAGVDFDMPDSGCCGMAGSFGFSEKHYDISIACGERVLLPAVREAADETLIIADGFSCQEQIEQTTNRRALHVAEVLQLAIHHGESGPPGPFPERAARGGASQSGDGAWRKPLLVGAGVVLAGGLAAWGAHALRDRR